VIAGNLADIFEIWDRSSLKVGAPVKAVFVCGGTTADDRPDDLTRRDAFFEIIDDAVSDRKRQAGLDKHQYKKAESIDGFLFREHYQDWLTLELDIARISEVTMLFCESPGAFAELGAFVVDPEIVQSLLVVIDHDKYNSPSFIRHGIITFLEKSFPKGSVFVLQTAEMGLSSVAMKGKDIDRDRFASAIGRALDLRLNQPLKHRTFDPKLSGHLIKLITGLLEDYGALTVEEIWYILQSMSIDIEDTEINRYIFCAENMGWAIRDRRDYGEYITSTTSGFSVTFKMNPDGRVKDRRRWRSDIREYWKTFEPDRFASITSSWSK
jgi:hypothetical protein|tara:strand:- start:79081 stop:80052 length:972 start_codon:yes stop_codon:yes gene_type:complete